MANDTLTPPSYCPDAIATDVGWINPANGELLVLVKNLRQQIANRNSDLALAAKNAEDAKVIAELTSVEETAIIKESSVPCEPPDGIATDVNGQPAKRKRGRPRKNP